MIRGLAIIFACLAVGEGLVYALGVRFPGSIVGMLLLALGLRLGVVREGWVQGVCGVLLRNLGFFFVPPGVALMLYFGVIRAQFVPIVTATVVSTALVLGATAWTHKAVRRWRR